MMKLTNKGHIQGSYLRGFCELDTESYYSDNALSIRSSLGPSGWCMRVARPFI